MPHIAANPLSFIPLISDIGGWEWLIIAVIAVILFGNRLPDLGRTLGKGLVSFRKGVNEMKDEITKAATEDVSGESEQTKPVDETESVKKDENQANCEGKQDDNA